MYTSVGARQTSPKKIQKMYAILQTRSTLSRQVLTEDICARFVPNYKKHICTLYNYCLIIIKHIKIAHKTIIKRFIFHRLACVLLSVVFHKDQTTQTFLCLYNKYTNHFLLWNASINIPDVNLKQQ